MSKVEQIKKDLRSIDTGYGLMSLTWRPDPPSRENQLRTMHQAVMLQKSLNKDKKIFFNAGEFYGPNRVNLQLIKEFFAKYPDLRSCIIISVKGGLDMEKFVAQGKYDDVLKSIKNCYDAMGGYIDIFEVARIDATIIPEGSSYPKETFDALVKGIENEWIGAISLSEVTLPQIKDIHQGFAKYLVCVELEFSLFSTQIMDDGTVALCDSLGLIIICYSPLGRGLLSEQVKDGSTLPDGDIRKNMKRFNGPAYEKNMELVHFLKNDILKDRSPQISTVQLALAWIKQWNSVYNNCKFIPIPSGSTVEKVTENFDITKSVITQDEFNKINEFLKNFVTQGDRYEHV
ncbi:hypothetical protein TBLA_0B08920 [Henningerozyma blattae CBS 6284]|uniref:NADP-dependent oxidoreductase domain-containing protein n=1 Tax=Henningerozyma blattae (strain ATCC 34711 / CBS 6284 / DSM 70876 / NBRC 10599 / NRRL Y-10934 / UCD 77-7) TaxID=1071380 RepID=I2H005_HENB6|nr:hypothetical protein TBLA_0B08920 [Tetrapisispora blattae CBS 6284]CCH59707.1 hypothetical protein TBLA_0B08920 [Tetrapisispora blattae CBS 6284]